MWFMADENNDYVEIASILRSTNDRKELREIAARQQAVDAAQTLRPIWTPFGYIRHDQLRSI